MAAIMADIRAAARAGVGDDAGAAIAAGARDGIILSGRKVDRLPFAVRCTDLRCPNKIVGKQSQRTGTHTVPRMHHHLPV